MYKDLPLKVQWPQVFVVAMHLTEDNFISRMMIMDLKNYVDGSAIHPLFLEDLVFIRVKRQHCLLMGST